MLRHCLRIDFPYAAKSALASMLALEIYHWLPWSGGAWAVVSAILTVQPSLNEAIGVSVNRVLANLLGGSIGVVVAALWGTHPFTLGAGIFVVSVLCHALKMEKALKSATASTAIVMFAAGTPGLHSLLERLAAVMIGCLAALLLNLLFHWFPRFGGR
jgi:uncharacterized membrane protein YgaE (UPF0421/DUF939 family)